MTQQFIVTTPGSGTTAPAAGTIINANFAELYGRAFPTSVSATLATGPLNDMGSSVMTGYVSGTTNRLLLTPASGGTTINGIDASGVTDGFGILIQNKSTTDALIFAHLASGSLSGNQFTNENAASVQIPPLGAARAIYIVNKWQFA